MSMLDTIIQGKARQGKVAVTVVEEARRGAGP
jgi:hypothetical protein